MDTHKIGYNIGVTLGILINLAIFGIALWISVEMFCFTAACRVLLDVVGEDVRRWKS